jgi:hypothetical protein
LGAHWTFDDQPFLHVTERVRGRRMRLVRQAGALAQDRGDGHVMGHDAGACGIGHAVHAALPPSGMGRPPLLSRSPTSCGRVGEAAKVTPLEGGAAGETAPPSATPRGT